jgi:hypothetical protein
MTVRVLSTPCPLSQVHWYLLEAISVWVVTLGTLEINLLACYYSASLKHDPRLRATRVIQAHTEDY